MKIEYTIPLNSSNSSLQQWLNEVTLSIAKSTDKNNSRIQDHGGELLEDFENFLKSSEDILDSNGKKLNPSEIYQAINHYKIRIEKLLLILNLRLYMTHNVNKETQVRYIVMRSMWIDDNGRLFRKFSKNLGAESKVLVNGKIPPHELDSVKDYITRLMWDQYYFEYLDDSAFGIDSEGNIVIDYD